MGKFIYSAFADEIDANLKKQMDVLESHGIDHIEMRGVNGKALVEHTLEEVRAIKKELDSRGFALSAVGSPIGKILITNDFEPHLELFRHTLDIARILETRYIRIFSFFLPEGKDPRQYRDEVMLRFSRIIEAARGSGLILLHENEGDVYGGSLARCLDLYETMACSYLKMAFDPGNFVMSGEPDCFETYLGLKKYVATIHAKDALYKEKIFVPSGEGDGRMKEILSDLYREDKDFFLSIEPHLAGHFPGDEPALFAMACNALKKLVNEVTGSV